MDPDMAAFMAEYDACDIREKLATADSGKTHQVNETGESKQDEQERVHRVRKDERATMVDKAESFSDLRHTRARDTRAPSLGPIHRRQSRQPNVAVLDSSHTRSHFAPRASSRPSRDTRALSPLHPQFGTSKKVVPVYSQVHAETDNGASMTMTPHASLISEAQQCNVSIKMADGSVLNSNIKRGFHDATCHGKLLPKIEALHVPDLAATLISSMAPQLDMEHSKHYGLFLQPACDSCPICTPHADRIMIATTTTDMSISITAMTDS